QLLPLRHAVERRADDVEALALGALHLVEELLVRTEPGEIDLDAGFVGEGLEKILGQFVRPEHHIELARARQGVLDIGRRKKRNGAGRSAGPYNAAAADVSIEFHPEISLGRRIYPSGFASCHSGMTV